MFVWGQSICRAIRRVEEFHANDHSYNIGRQAAKSLEPYVSAHAASVKKTLPCQNSELGDVSALRAYQCMVLFAIMYGPSGERNSDY